MVDQFFLLYSKIFLIFQNQVLLLVLESKVFTMMNDKQFLHTNLVKGIGGNGEGLGELGRLLHIS